MQKTFYLENERITLREAKELLGKKYSAKMKEAKETFLSDPATCTSYLTHRGCLTIEFKIN